MQEVSNFSRFYGIFKFVSYNGDKEELKKELVQEFTNGRTDSLKEIRLGEYNELCKCLEQKYSKPTADLYKQHLKKQRSNVLHQMQLMGIDISNWSKVNAFCENKRIAGKAFRELSVEDLEALYKKLRAIRRKDEMK